MIIIEDFKEPSGKDGILLQGLPGIGFVGILTAEFFLSEYDSELLFTLLPDDSMPVSVISDGYIAKMREEYKVYEIFDLSRPIYILTGARQPERTIYETLNKVLEKLKPSLSDVVAVGGMTGVEEPLGAFTYSEETAKRLEEKGLPPIKVQGYMSITGAVAVLPKLAKLLGLNARGLLSKVHESPMEAPPFTSFIDPIAAKRAVKALDSVYELGIEEEKLKFFEKKEEEARKIRESMQAYVTMKEASKEVEEETDEKYYV